VPKSGLDRAAEALSCLCCMISSLLMTAAAATMCGRGHQTLQVVDTCICWLVWRTLKQLMFSTAAKGVMRCKCAIAGARMTAALISCSSQADHTGWQAAMQLHCTAGSHNGAPYAFTLLIRTATAAFKGCRASHHTHLGSQSSALPWSLQPCTLCLQREAQTATGAQK
jgi:hypothetical protein